MMTAAKKKTVKRTAASSDDKRSMRLAVVLAVFALAVVVAAFVYARHAAAQPENILRQALARSLQSKSSEISLLMSNGVSGERPTILQIRGPITDEGHFDLSGTYKRDGKGISLAVRSADGRDAYLKLDNVSEFADVMGKEAAEYGVTADNNPLKRVENTWLTVPANLKDTVIYNQPIDGRKSPVLSGGDKQLLAELYRQHDFLAVRTVFDDEPVDMVPSHHYALTIDHERLRSYLTAVQNGLKTVKLREKQAASFVAAAQQARSLEVWISRDDRRIVRAIYNGAATDDGVERIRNVELLTANYDKPVIINNPEKSLPLFEALTGLSGGAKPTSE